MVTHWESSTRPLFVKTVWRDGQHHVVLRKDEEPVAKKNLHSSNHNSARSIRSTKTTTSSNKKGSGSVKLVLAGVGTFNATEKKLLRPLDLTSPKETSGDLRNPRGILNQSSRYKIGKNLNLCVKSNSIDVNVERENYDKLGIISPYFTCNNYVEPYTDTLSERVMVWLDLAIQNGNYTKELKIQPQRIVTACHISQKRQHSAVKRRSLADCKLNTNCDREEDTFHVEGISQSVNSSDLVGDVISKENDARHQLSSEVEENIVVKGLEQTLPRKKMNSVKRQLHIFMPNLPNKYSDCDSSILSSKVSTCSLQRSVHSKKSKNSFK